MLRRERSCWVRWDRDGWMFIDHRGSLSFVQGSPYPYRQARPLSLIDKARGWPVEVGEAPAFPFADISF
jgi:hypothetical protein